MKNFVGIFISAALLSSAAQPAHGQMPSIREIGDRCARLLNLDVLYRSPNLKTIHEFSRVPGKPGNEVFRGSEPLTDADFRFLKKRRIDTIVTLQVLPWHWMREQKLADKYGIRLVIAPIEGSPIAPSESSVDFALAALRNKKFGRKYVHCYLGQHRTGLIVALHEHAEGVPDSIIRRELLKDGFNPTLFNKLRLGGLFRYLDQHFPQEQD